MNIRFYENTFAKNAQGISKIYHEVLLLIKFLQTLRQVKNLNIKYFDLYYTVIKTRDGKNIKILNMKIILLNLMILFLFIMLVDENEISNKRF